MADKSLDILIRILTQEVGAERADKILQKIKAEARSAGVESQTQEKETAKRVTETNLRLDQKHKLIQQLQRAFPAAGMAARFFVNPLTAGLSVAIGLFVAVKRHLDDWNRAMDAMEARNRNADFAPGIEAAAAALRQGAVSAREYEISLRAIGEQARSAAHETDGQVKKLHELMAAQAEINNEQEALALARVSNAPNLSEPQKLVARAAIRAHYRGQADTLARRRGEEELGIREAALMRAQADQPGLEGAAADAQARQSQLRAAAERARTDISESRGRTRDTDRNKLVEALATATEKFDREFAFNENLTEPLTGMDSATGRAKRKLDAAEAALNLFNQEAELRARAEKRLRELTEKQLPEAEQAARAAQDAARRNKEFIAGESAGIPADRERLGRAVATRGTVSGLVSERERVELEGELRGRLERIQEELDRARAAREKSITDAVTSGKAADTAAADKMIQDLEKALERFTRAVEAMMRGLDTATRRIQGGYLQ